MEVNKDAAEDCFSKGKQFLSQGNLEKAKKLFERSKRLYPLPNVDNYINKCSSQPDTPQSNQDQDPTPSPSPNDSNQGEGSGLRHRKRANSNAQRELVDRINHLKDYYQILGVSKDASDADIKKAYRKLALQLHPDKNHEKGAEEAFKKVNAAFKVLSDSQSKREYDQYGDTTDSEQRYTHYQQTYEQNFDPNDFFNAFFGGNGGFDFGDDNNFYGNGGNVRYYHYGGNGADDFFPFMFTQQRRRGGARYQQEEEVPLSRRLLTILPIIFLFTISIYLNAKENNFSFSTYRTSQYTVSRTIELPSNTLHYYVKSSFDPTQYNVNQIEARVLNEYKQHYYTACYNDKRFRRNTDSKNCKTYQEILRRTY